MRNLFNRKKAPAQRTGTSAVSQLDADSIKQIIRYFPIGNKVQYVPMFMENILLDSIVIGYSINNHIVFSKNEFEIKSKDGQLIVSVIKNNKKSPFEPLNSFYFVIPKEGGDLSKLDLISKAALGKNGQFTSGKDITLISCPDTERGVAHIDNYVKRTMMLKDGFYANHEIVLLEALADTLVAKDQRQHSRVDTSIPVVMKVKGNEQELSCVLKDFSEKSFRLDFGTSKFDLGKLNHTSVTIKVDDGKEFGEKIYLLGGTITRTNEDSLVVKLEKIYRDDKFIDLHLIDLLEIKSSLLHHPETQKRLSRNH